MLRRALSAFLLLPTLALRAQDAPTALETAIAAHLDEHRQRHGNPGVSAACVLPDGTVVAVARGQDAAGAALTPASKLMSGSIGKTYCAAIALQLVAEGKLALDGRVQDVLGRHQWYARIANADSITLRQLLNHTSGVPEHVWKKEFQDAVRVAGDRAMSPEECLRYALGEPPVAPAGEKWSYADTNYLLVGLCIEQATGQRYWQVLRERLLAPLQLSETVGNESRAIPGLACGMAGGIGFHEGPVVQGGKYFTNPVFEYCGGGVSSSARDLARWCRELFAGEVIPASLRTDFLDGVPAARGVADRYGLGCFVDEGAHGPAFGHTGVMPGYLGCMSWYPNLKMAVAVQFPTDESRRVGGMKRLCADLAALCRQHATAGQAK
jgi:D-alanyl-D-alanine carboxypeptidase